MWTADLHPIDQQATKGTLRDSSGTLSFRSVINLWQNDQAFRGFFTTLLGNSSYQAFFWETPPVTRQSLDQSFEFVLTESPSLAKLKPDSSSFATHFSQRKSQEVLTFPNLGGDAILIVPVPLVMESCYTHLARFLREGPSSQISAFWQSAGVAMQSRVSSSPTWLSTAGMGVPWLHLRLDSRPKYYRHAPYCKTR